MVTKLSTLRLLVVDDEAGISDSLKDYFELEGHHVETAHSGNHALQILADQKFDVVVSDVRMPDGDGRHLLKSIRKAHPTEPVVILMSGFSDFSVEEVLAEGGVAMLSKPFHPNDLVNIVKKTLSRPEERWPHQWVTGAGAKIHFEAKTLTEAIEKNGVKVGLTGLFVKKDPSGFRVGDQIEIDFSKTGARIFGILRWVRNKIEADRQPGFGVEILGMTEDLRQEFVKLNLNPSSGVCIPRE